MKRTEPLAALLAVACVGGLTTGRAQADTPPWRVVEGADLGGHAKGLLDVAAAGPRHVYAVGYGCSAEDSEGCRGVERWDGSRWRKVPTPSGAYHVEGVSTDAANDVWLVGNSEVSWAAHWDGARWRSYRPFGSREYDYVRDVAVSSRRPWFAGQTQSGRGVVLTWSASTGFRQVYGTPGALTAVTARGDDVWAVGSTGGGPLVVRRAGGEWSVSPTPSIPGGTLTRVWQVAANDVWAVGHVGATLAASRPISLHFDGTSWRQVPVPVAQGRLSGLTSDGSGTVWASGVDLARGGQVLFLRYSGGTWVPSYGPALAIPPQRDYDPKTVTKTSITRVPGSATLWAVASAGGGDREQEFILRRG